MPYRSTVDLPPAVRERLPIHAQEIFLAAFNNAFEEYAGRADDAPTGRRSPFASPGRL